MFPYVIRRLVQLIPTFLLSTMLIFFIVQAAPGDMLSPLRADPTVKPQTIQRLEKQYALDKPVVVQYVYWLKNLAQGDLGESFQAKRPVAEVVKPRLLNSLILVGLSTLILYAVAIPIGVYGALKPYSFMDRVFSVFAYFGLGIPSFFFALLVMFGLVRLKQNFGWDVPISGKSSASLDAATGFSRAWDIFLHALAPSIIVVLRSISSESRFLRGQMLEVLGQDYIRTANAKGLSINAVTYKHAFRLAVIPLIATIGGLLPGLLGGAGFVEVVFNWPGLTPLLLNALSSQDLFIIVSTTALTAILYIIGNILGDLLLAAVDPRIRYS